jgi:hypothetical protein
MPFKEVIIVNKEEEQEKGLLDDLKKRLLEDERSLTSADLDVYAQKIVQELKKITAKDRPAFLERVINVFRKKKNAEKKQQFFLVDEFDERALALLAQNISESDAKKVIDNSSENKLKKEKEFDEELYKTDIAALENIKNAFIERLQSALNEEKELKDINYSDILFSKSSIKSQGNFLNSRVKLADDLNNKEYISRDDQDDEFDQLPEEEKELYLEGRKKRLELPSHPNIVETQGVGARDIVGKLELTDASRESATAPVRDLLIAMRGYVDGALYYEKNNLVIDDISLDGCGMVRDGKNVKGVAFDLGRVAPLGKKAATSSVPKPLYAVPSEFFPEGKTSGLQMTYQFGRSLRILEQRLRRRPDVSAAVLDRMKEISSYATTIESVPVVGQKEEKKVYPELKVLRDSIEALIEDLPKLESSLGDELSQVAA